MKVRPILAPNPGPFTLDGTQSWLLGETTIIDPGPAIDSHLDELQRAMPSLQTILITHRHGDHAPAAVPLKARTGARILAPRGVLADESVDRRISGGEILDIDGESLEVIATPGHTEEHVCFLTASGDLFTGDTILGFGTTAIFPPDGRMSNYLRSLRTLLARDPVRVYPAHGPIREDAVALIESYIAHRLEREAQILETIGRGATSIAQMREWIYPGLDPHLHRAADAQLTAHLIKLVEERRADAALLNG